MKRIGLFAQIFVVFIPCLWINTVAAALNPTAPLPDHALSQTTAVQAFIQDMVLRHQFSAHKLQRWFEGVTPNARVIALMEQPTENLTWHAYRKRVITPIRIQQGIAFWQQHESVVTKATQMFGVPPEILVAILGLESSYGKITGHFSVFEALSTLAFYYPRRAEFFKKELIQYLLFTREEGLDPLAIKGSYAGAMGPAQFMPSSCRQYAVDAKQSGKRDMLTHLPNVIYSIANFLKTHGWQQHAPVAYPAQPLKANATPVNKQLTLEGKAGQEHWTIYPNFNVLKCYNRSNHYAMAVHVLSQQIKQGKQTNMKK